MLDFDGQYVHLFRKLEDFFARGEGTVDVRHFGVYLFRGRGGRIEDCDGDAERVGGFAEHLAELAATEEADLGIHRGQTCGGRCQWGLLGEGELVWRGTHELGALDWDLERFTATGLWREVFEKISWRFSQGALIINCQGEGF